MAEAYKTGIIRVSYPHLFEKSPVAEGPDAKEKYSIVGVVADQDEIRNLKRYVQKTFTAKHGKKRGKASLSKDYPLRSGEERDDYPDDAVFFSAKADRRPIVVDRKGEELDDDGTIYGGCYCRLILQAYGWTYGKKPGVSLSLLGVQFVKDGEAYGDGVNRAAVVEMFDELDEEDLEDFDYGEDEDEDEDYDEDEEEDY